MVSLIPVFLNDYILTLVDIIIILLTMKLIKANRKDKIVLISGFIVMTISEYFFIKTGVEVFKRQTLLGLMPLWLPFLWAYGFVAISRSVRILENR